MQKDGGNKDTDSEIVLCSAKLFENVDDGVCRRCECNL